MSRHRPNRSARGSNASGAGPDAELARLKRELDEVRTRLQEIERDGIAAVTARRLAALEEGQLVARGQAVDAVLARSKAEAELQKLRDAINAAPGVRGWLLRGAARKMVVRS